MRPIIVIGSLNADLVIRVPRFPVPGETLVGMDFKVFSGGKGANQAYGAGKLGAQVRMAGQVGNDREGGALKEGLAVAGVDVTYVKVDSSISSGIASITINDQGQNQIIIIPGANGTFTPAALTSIRPLFTRETILLLQLEIPLETVQRAAEWAKESGAVVILDPAPARGLPDDLLRCVDYLTPNESELAVLMGRAPASLTVPEAIQLARELRARGARKVIVKMGAQGALLVVKEREHFWPALPVQAVDTTAAGDAFNAAFAVAVARGSSEVEAGQFAVAAAAISVTRVGAQASMPSLEEVLSLLRTAAD